VARGRFSGLTFRPQSVGGQARAITRLGASLAFDSLAVGLLVPKPSTNGDYQRRSAPDLGQTVHGSPLASTVAVAIVTHLVAQSFVRAQTARWARHAWSTRYEKDGRHLLETGLASYSSKRQGVENRRFVQIATVRLFSES